MRLELTSEMHSPPVFETGSSTSRMTSRNCVGRNRTHVTTVQSRLPVPAQAPPHQMSVCIAGAGIEPANPSFKATDFYQQKLPRIVKSALRESNPPVQLGRLAPLPLGQGHVQVSSKRKRWDSNPQASFTRHLFSRQGPQPAGSLPFNIKLQWQESNLRHGD